MSTMEPSSHLDPQGHYAELLRCAARALPRWLAGKVAPSDVVQEALMNVCDGGERTRGRSHEEQLAVLRRVVDNIVLNHIRDFFRGKRDVRLELRLAADGSAVDPAARQPSPSEQADRHEQAARLEEAILALPDRQRTAVFLHCLQGKTVADIAAVLDRSESAVGGLLKRGLEQLRKRLGPAE